MIQPLKKIIRHLVVILIPNILKFPFIAKSIKKILQLSPRLYGKLQRVANAQKNEKLYSPKSVRNTHPLNTDCRILFFYVDHTVQSPSNRGPERVARMLSRSLLDIGMELRFVKWSNEKRRLVYINHAELRHLENWNGPVLGKEERNRYTNPKNSDHHIQVHFHAGHWLIVPEVTHTTQRTITKTRDIIKEAQAMGFRTAYIFYDLAPIHRSELATDASRHAEYTRDMLGADIVFPISEWSRQDLIRYLSKETNPGTDLKAWAKTIPLPAESIIGARNNNHSQIVKHKNLILSVGNITPHKNQLALMRAFDKYCRKNDKTNWRLVLVGNLHPLVRDEFSQLLKDNQRIHWDGDASDNKLKSWYNKCAFTVFPSLMEGYGLPIVESIWLGKPCICANFGAMAEAGSLPGCMGIDTNDENAMESAIAELIENPTRLETLTREAIDAQLTTWHEYARAIILALEESEANPTKPILWIDVTELAAQDAGTGIQRVTRSLAKRILLNPPSGFDVKLIRISPDGSAYTIADALTAKLLHLPETVDHNLAISFRRNDIFLGLDLVPQSVTVSEWLKSQKIKGALIIFVLYDLILFRNPEFFHDGATDTWFTRYLQMIKEFSDTIICISESTAKDYTKWIDEHYPLETYRPKITWAHLGADIEESGEKGTISAEESSIIKSLTGKLNFLMVGTLEPRKGHSQALDALELLWKSGVEVNLIILGKAGWKIEGMIERLHDHPEIGKRLFWFKDAGDEFLECVYAISTVLIAASYSEGFGLPIIEASRHQLHVLARDIPIFREVAGNHARYFNASNAPDLANQIQKWIADYTQALLPLPGNIPWVTWNQCSENVKQIIEDSSKAALTPGHDILVSIIIPVYNNVGLTRQCIDSIYAQPSITPFEVIVIDDASTDDTEPYLRSVCAKVRSIRNSSNLRFAASCNAGSRIARGNYLLFLNNDTIVEKGWIDALVSRAKSDPNIGITGARLLYPNRTIQHCGLEFVDGVAKMGVSPIHRLRNEPCDHYHASYPMKVSAVTGACLLIKKTLFQEIGGFDESYVMYYEDVDLCFKVAQRGYDIIYEPDSIVVHLERQSFDSKVDRLLTKALDIFNSKWAEAVKNLGPLAKGIPYDSQIEHTSFLQEKPRLSICITTYNRAKWLNLNLLNISALLRQHGKEIEIIVCDNASTDETPEVVKPYLDSLQIKYIRNEKNVGMLGNLKETCKAASGAYVWLIGDDDFVMPGAVENILSAIDQHPSVSLIYLNFSYTNETDTSVVTDLNHFISSATPITAPTADFFGSVAEITGCSDNFFTAIYCIVFRRDHALRTYSQNTDGPPFSSMITCIPTTFYVLNKMMREQGLWMGNPQIVGNLNNSWNKYAPLWILERIPEAHDLAELRGANPGQINHWRKMHMPHMKYWFKDIYFNDPLNNVAHFDIVRMLKRIENLEDFPQYLPYFEKIYRMAYRSKKPGAHIDPKIIFKPYRRLLS